MLFPEFSIERISYYGLSNDHEDKPHFTNNKATWSPHYELRFFYEDWIGGPVIDGVFYTAAKGYFSRYKPMQPKNNFEPYRCCVMDIATQNPQLIDALNALPTYALHPQMDTIISLFKKMLSVSSRSSLNGQLEIYQHAISILLLLFQQLPNYNVESSYDSKPRRHQETLLAALQYLKEHLDEDVDLEKLAKDSHLHPTYFHKLFTEAFGRTPTQQLMRNRINKAMEYMQDDNCSLSEIASKCGFSSPSYFSYKFKEIIKETPTQHRNSIRRRKKQNSAK